MFGNKGLLNRCLKAVTPNLEPGETVQECLWLRDPAGNLGELLLAVTLPATIDSWILTLTDRRVLVHHGNNYNAAKSEFVGACPRQRVALIAHEPGSITLSFNGDGGHRYLVLRLWRDQAVRFAQALQAG